MNGTLVYLLCSLANPALCEEHALFIPSVMQCVHGAQATLAATLRPGWRVARWRCEPDDRPEREATAADRPELGYIAGRAGAQDMMRLP